MIVEFRNAFTKNFCQRVIDYYYTQESFVRHDNELFSFNEVTVEDYNLSMDTFAVANDMYDRYKKLNNLYIFPKQNNFEKLRIKKYDEKDRFDWHVDVGDYASAKRFLIGMIYLNDNFTGGETQFGNQNQILKTIEPETGKMVFFPPFWTHPHRGNEIHKGNKYIMNVYFQYV